MATYYVRKNGSDANSTAQAQDPATAWLTVDKAANNVAAGDTVYIGAGVYRELVTIDTNGSSGSPITWIGDVTGKYTGDAGLVIISAFDAENEAASRASVLVDASADVKYNSFNWLTFIGGLTAAVLFDYTGAANAYEGLEFNDCEFVAGNSNSNFLFVVDYQTVAALSGNGLRINRCKFNGGGIYIFYKEDTTEKDWDLSISDCLFVDAASASNSRQGVVFDREAVSTTPPGGASITNCTFSGLYTALRSIDAITTAPANKWVVRNCWFRHCNIGFQVATTSPFDSDYNTFTAVATSFLSVTAGDNDRQNVDDPGLIGGMGDWLLHKAWGWSPFKPWEPMALNDGSYVHAVIGNADSAVAPADDTYGSPRPMGSEGWDYLTYYFDGSDAAASDPGGVWTNETNFDDGSTATSATTTTVGSVSADYIMVEGTNAPATGATIDSVEFRLHAGATSDLGYNIQTDGQSEQLLNGTAGNLNGWGSWFTLNAPTGGWTWAKIQALEIRVWCTTSPDNADVTRAEIRVAVSGDVRSDDRGAVEARGRFVKETGTVRTGANALKAPGPGHHDFIFPVNAQSTTVNIYGYIDSNYTGARPTLELMNAPGVTTLPSTTLDINVVNSTPVAVGAGAATTTTFTKPDWGQTDDDYWLLALALDDGDPEAQATTPSGFSTFVTRNAGASRPRRLVAWYKKVNTTTDPTSWSSTHDSEDRSGMIALIRGADSATFEDVADTNNNYTNTSAPQFPAITTATNYAQHLVLVASNDDTDPGFDAPTGYDTIQRDVSSTAIGVPSFGAFSKIIPAAGAVSAAALGGTTTSADMIVGSVALRPAVGEWVKMSITFTPTAQGVARVRVSSLDTSTTGEAFFDDLTVE